MRLASVVTGALCLAILTTSGTSLGSAFPDLGGRVRLLTAPEFAGRGNGTPELDSVADTLVSWLAAAGLEPGYGESWSQEFELSGVPDGLNTAGRNIAGYWPGRGRLESEIVVVSAHYDHLGRVEPLAVGLPDSVSYFPGANDNASGVSVLFDLVESLTSNSLDQGDRRSVLFVLFGGEEIGLQGSAHFVGQPGFDQGAINAVLNFDTVGVITNNQLYVSGLGSAQPFVEIVAGSENGDLQLKTTQSIWGGSDHMSFVSREIPTLFVFGGPYANYNRTTDTWSNMDRAGFERVAKFSSSLLQNMITYSLPIDWQEGFVANESREIAGDENRDTWFGSLPDFGDEASGYAIGGVFENSPAERAGLSKGDVLIEMGGRPVAGLVDFTQILRAHNPGDLIEVVVVRSMTQMRFTVVLGSRQERQ
ncbi:MAG: hypothetical protein ACI9UK_000429 [Candidatus Krumholzibacteriia bacterium]|jgi:hypothetical protein